MYQELSVYRLKHLPEEERAALGYRILIMRRWPRGIARRDIDCWLPDAAPAEELLDAHRKGTMAWSDFTAAYRTQMHQSGPLDLLRELEGQYGTITLLCWEQTGPCHRFLLKELLENAPLEAERQERSATL